MTLERQQADWEELATVDPLWAILSDPSKRGDRWDLDEFFRSGAVEIESVVARAREMGHPRSWATALDFGCGVGRLTRALAGCFDRCVGIDVAAPMIEQARRLNEDRPNCTFELNSTPDLRRFEMGEFDLVYTNIVLQHMLSRELIEGYIAEFHRVLAPGGLAVFQLPSAIPLRFQLQPRRHLYRLGRAVRMRPEVLQNRLGLYPISMRAIPEADVVALIGREGGDVLAIDRSEISGFGIASATYWVTRP